MKKLFASLMAATMVAGMSVSAFAYVDEAGNTPAGSNHVTTASDDNYGFGAAMYNKALVAAKTNDTVYGGDKIYFPIVANVHEVADDKDIETGGKYENTADGEYYYATKASEVEDLKVSFKETQAKGAIKSAEIKRVDAGKAAPVAAGKVYAIEVKLNDYFKTEENDFEFDLTLKEKGKEMQKVEDIFFRLGQDDDNKTIKTDGKDENSELGYGYDAKFKKSSQCLELTVGKNTKAVTLDEVNRTVYTLKSTDNNKIEELYMETADGEMIVEGKLEEQDPLFLGFETDPTDFQKAVMIENNKADVDVMNWVARPTFDFSMDVTVPVDEDRDNFLYEEIDGKLVEVKAELNEDGDELQFKTKTLGKYLLSDMELTAEKAEAAEEGEEAKKDEATAEKEDDKKANAETGAAVVAVATAIALF